MPRSSAPRSIADLFSVLVLLVQGSAKTKEEKVARLPDFSALRLGSCAIEGNADNVLKGKYGKEIDEHDFVVRFNVVTKPYKEAVGTKAHGIFYKTNYKSDLKPKMFNFFPKYVPMELDPKDLPGGVPPLIHSRLDLHEWRFDLEQVSGSAQVGVPLPATSSLTPLPLVFPSPPPCKDVLGLP